MQKTRNNKYIDNEKQVDSLEEFGPQIREILRQYKAKRQLSHIAKRLGFHPARLTEMITKDGNGEYKRRITAYYVAKLIDGGVMTVSQILDGRKLEDLPDRSRLFFERMILPRKTIQLVVEAQQRGLDVDGILETALFPKKRK